MEVLKGTLPGIWNPSEAGISLDGPTGPMDTRKEQQKRFLLKLTERSVTVAIRSQSIVSVLVRDRQPVYVDQFSVARDGDTNGNS
ncbi:Tensin-3 [Manis pentadactyla]|nr:Tensin-3 [Manis pentadactyla]